MRPLRFVSWAIAVAIVVHAASTYAALPDVIPTHLSLDGRADAFAPRTPWRWALLPGIAVLMQSFLAVLAHLIPSRPHLINIPDKERFLLLPREYQAPALLEVVRMLDIAALGIGALMFAIQWQMAQAAAGVKADGGIVMLLAPFGLTFAMLFMVTRISSAVERGEKRWKEAGSPAGP